MKIRPADTVHFQSKVKVPFLARLQLRFFVGRTKQIENSATKALGQCLGM
jgi:hypothetical protein